MTEQKTTDSQKMMGHLPSTMKELPESERPDEKCLMNGAAVLSDAELLSIIIRSGSRGQKAIDTAFALLQIDKDHPGLEGLLRLDSGTIARSVKGIGRVKALQIEAVCELARRISRIKYRQGQVFQSPQSVADYYMSSMRELRQEELHIMMLDNAKAMIRERRITVGTVNSSLIDPREIFIEALRSAAVSIILVHNHPSGVVTPSSQDIQATRRVRDCGRLLGIDLVDHIIIGNMNYVSLRELGILELR